MPRQSIPILRQLKIEHGPPELLTRFFFKAANAVADRGVLIELGTFEQLMEVNRCNLASWFPMTTSFVPGVGEVSDETGFVIFGRDLQGKVVATQVARFLDWRETNFKQEAESLRFFYADPERHKAPEERCMVSAPMATEISGRLLHSGGVWYHPDYRGRQLGAIIPRIGRALGYTRWDTEATFGVVTQNNVDKRVHYRIGYKEVSESVTMHKSPTYPDGDLNLVLVRQKCIDLIDDTFSFVADFETQVDSRVGHRRAQ